jgi:hypothetical protein
MAVMLSGTVRILTPLQASLYGKNIQEAATKKLASFYCFRNLETAASEITGSMPDNL